MISSMNWCDSSMQPIEYEIWWNDCSTRVFSLSISLRSHFKNTKIYIILTKGLNSILLYIYTSPIQSDFMKLFFNFFWLLFYVQKFFNAIKCHINWVSIFSRETQPSAIKSAAKTRRKRDNLVNLIAYIAWVWVLEKKGKWAPVHKNKMMLLKCMHWIILSVSPFFFFFWRNATNIFNVYIVTPIFKSKTLIKYNRDKIHCRTNFMCKLYEINVKFELFYPINVIFYVPLFYSNSKR